MSERAEDILNTVRLRRVNGPTCVVSEKVKATTSVIAVRRIDKAEIILGEDCSYSWYDHELLMKNLGVLGALNEEDALKFRIDHLALYPRTNSEMEEVIRASFGDASEVIQRYGPNFLACPWLWVTCVIRTNSIPAHIMGFLFPNAAIYNHSCEPNCMYKISQTSEFNCVHMIAIYSRQRIRVSEECTIYYGQTNPSSNVQVRRDVILKNHGFRCHCSRCMRESAGLDICLVCGIDKGLSRCGGCNNVQYCSKKCQVFHWSHGHKEECKKV